MNREVHKIVTAKYNRSLYLVLYSHYITLSYLIVNNYNVSSSEKVWPVYGFLPKLHFFICLVEKHKQH